MVAPSVSDKPDVKRGRRSPLIIGIIMIAISSGGYLGWRHFGISLPFGAEAPARSRHRDDSQAARFPDHADRDRKCDGAEHGDGPQHGHRADPQHRLQDGQFVKKGQLLAQLDPSTFRRSSTRRRPISPEIRPICKMPKSISTDMYRWRRKALHRSSRSPLSRRWSPSSRPR